MSRYDELQKLQELRTQGVLTEDEFQAEKNRLLNSPGSSAGMPPPPPLPGRAPAPNLLWGMEPRTYCMLLHFSQLLGYAVPVVGYAVPIVMWAANKDASRDVDMHGRIVLNWLITELIAAFIFALLLLVFIGFPLLIILMLVGLVFPIIGGLKANDGKVWEYPFSIRFL